MSVLTGTEIYHSNGQTEMDTETEYKTLYNIGLLLVSLLPHLTELLYMN